MIWIFWVCQLSPMWYNIDWSQLMSWFDHYQLQLIYPTMENPPARNLHHETLQTTFDTFDHSQHLFCTLHNFFLHISCVFTFLEIIKYNMPKCYIFSSIFNIKMATHKFTNFDGFFKYMLIWQLSHYNLTKLFPMTFKTTKHY